MTEAKPLGREGPKTIILVPQQTPPSLPFLQPIVQMGKLSPGRVNFGGAGSGGRGAIPGACALLLKVQSSATLLGSVFPFLHFQPRLQVVRAPLGSVSPSVKWDT